MFKMFLVLAMIGTVQASDTVESVSGTAPFTCFKSKTKDYTIDCLVTVTIPPPPPSTTKGAIKNVSPSPKARASQMEGVSTPNTKTKVNYQSKDSQAIVTNPV